MTERRLSGKVVQFIDGKDDMLETLKKVEEMKITNEEKDLLFVITQSPSIKTKQEVLKELETITQTGRFYTIAAMFPKIIQDKIDKIKCKDSREIIEIAQKLTQRIENNEITL